MSGSVSKIVAERNQRTLLELVLKPGNDACADCKARAPRWASYNLGIFICVSCASIHRKIGTHVTKVKSITLDEWTKEQVEVMKANGNVKSNALYNPNEARHPPPANMIDSERDSELEKFIRSKYEYKRFMDRRSGSTTHSSRIVRKTSPGPPPPPKTPQNLPPRLHTLMTIPSLPQNAPLPQRSASQPLLSLSTEKLTGVTPQRQQLATAAQEPVGDVWQDLISLGAPSQSSSLPLQYNPVHPEVPFASQPAMTPGSPFMSLPLGQATPITTSPLLVSAPGTPFVSTSPLSSPAVHLAAVNPFNQVQLLSSTNASAGASGNTPAYSTSPNPFTSVPMTSVAMSTPATPAIAAPTGSLVHTSPLPHVPLQTPMQMQMPVNTLLLTSASFANTPTPGVVQNPLTPAGLPGRAQLSAGVSTNPFSAMPMGRPAFSAPGAGPSPQAAFTNHPHFHQQHFGGWAGPSPQ